MNPFFSVFLVAIGGAIGSVGRYALSALTMRWAMHHHIGNFPWGTLLVNLIGCTLIGIFALLVERLSSYNGELRLLLITGLVGGFTTFSTFALDSWVLIQKGAWLPMSLYLAGSVIGGIVLIGWVFWLFAHSS